MNDALPVPVNSRARKRRRRLLPGLLRRKAAARYLAVSVPTLDRLNSAGLIPQPARLGGCLCWSREWLAAWIRHGCPPRTEWNTIHVAIMAAERRGRVRMPDAERGADR